jgi:hypothetical protein
MWWSVWAVLNTFWILQTLCKYQNIVDNMYLGYYILCTTGRCKTKQWHSHVGFFWKAYWKTKLFTLNVHTYIDRIYVPLVRPNIKLDAAYTHMTYIGSVCTNVLSVH